MERTEGHKNHGQKALGSVTSVRNKLISSSTPRNLEHTQERNEVSLARVAGNSDGDQAT